MEWILENKEWIFSGIGVSIIGLILIILKKSDRKKSTKMKQKSGKNCTNIQIKGDYKR